LCKQRVSGGDVTRCKYSESLRHTFGAALAPCGAVITHRPTPAGSLASSSPRVPYDPAAADFLELRLALVRIALPEAPELLEPAREALRVVGRNANHAVRSTDVRRDDDLLTGVCFAARSHIAEARQILAAASVEYSELVRARRRLYRGLSVVAEALSATTVSRAKVRVSDIPPARQGHGVLFAQFLTQVAAATRTNPKDIGWVLDVADAELAITAAHPRYTRLATEHRNTLRAIRGEMAAWSAGTRHPDAGYSLLNRLILQVDCMNH
jgi:hypothetical protein